MRTVTILVGLGLMVSFVGKPPTTKPPKKKIVFRISRKSLETPPQASIDFERYTVGSGKDTLVVVIYGKPRDKQLLDLQRQITGAIQWENITRSLPNYWMCFDSPVLPKGYRLEWLKEIGKEDMDAGKIVVQFISRNIDEFGNLETRMSHAPAEYVVGEADKAESIFAASEMLFPPLPL
jgi:hypothetical protein